MASGVDLPTLKSVLKHLRDLAHHFKKDEHGFQEEEISHFEEIAIAMEELDAKRRHAHDRLEVETIKASLLRQKLHTIPNEISRERAAAVSAARDTNSAELKNLRHGLSATLEEIQELQKKHNFLENDNSALMPELEKWQSQKDEIIYRLNEQMSERANMQITLNDTHKQIQESRETISRLEVAREDLLKAMAQERAQFALNKEGILKEMENEKSLVGAQREMNAEKRKDVEQVTKELSDQQCRLDNQYQLLSRVQGSLALLEAARVRETARQEQGVQQQQELRKRSKRLTEGLTHASQTLGKRISVLRETQSKTNKALADAEEMKKSLQARRSDTEARLVQARELEAKELANKEDAIKQFQASRSFIDEKTEMIARLQRETVDLEESMRETQEKSKAVMNSYNQQLEEHKEWLAKARHERMAVISEKESIQMEIREMRAEANKFILQLDGQLEKDAQKQRELTDESRQLQTEIAEKIQMIPGLQQHLTEEKEQCRHLECELTACVKRIEEELVRVTEVCEQKEQEMQQTAPVLQQLQAELQGAQKLYNERKHEIAAIKSKRRQMEEMSRQMQQEIENFSTSKGQLQSELREARNEFLQQLKDQGDELQALETNIYETCGKREQVTMENCRFKLCNVKFAEDITQLETDAENHKQAMKDLEKNRYTLEANLQEGWVKCAKSQKEYDEGDECIVESLLELMKRTQRRQMHIGKVTLGLEDQMSLFGKILDRTTKSCPLG
ncbi:coiled-coil domain-containing protein 175 isoform X1 [Lethenteron reissneri]|uniref:coiled-coil domain-containing protein 175 isoform X1 n=3 Tax=Lethenteron reissneri TaxID=7753 RepID=UPI002AB69BA6|nr:coiled-coil domain-containing protein 175 isoform X1 [Lethenteron reissneri]